MSYDLKRLRLKGIIWREPNSTKYWATTYGIRAATFMTRLHARVLRPGAAIVDPAVTLEIPHRLGQALNKVNQEIDNMLETNHLTTIAS